MSQWLHLLGHSPGQINALNVVHIAGTKGKGSTCAFTESFLRAHQSRLGQPFTTGLYTSPHLIIPEERIRINSHPISRDLFTKYFYELYDSLPELSCSGDSDSEKPLGGPGMLQLYALLALHVFVKEQVDVAILETHNGGEYDATNVVERPIVTAITTLGMDHVERLGPTIENIAWHKAGIYKESAVALSTTQLSAPAQVLRDRAAAKGRQVRFVEEDCRLPAQAWPLRVSVQKKNASLAIAAVEAWLASRPSADDHGLSSADIELGVQQWSWPGRFEVIERPHSIWFLDTAHNDMSVRSAAQWFSSASLPNPDSREPMRVLLFSHISEERDIVGLLETLANALKGAGCHVDHVIFSTYDASEQEKGYRVAKDPAGFHRVWTEAFPDSGIWDEPTIEGACRLVERLSQESADRRVHAFVTGSQHLVGPVIRHLDKAV